MKKSVVLLMLLCFIISFSRMMVSAETEKPDAPRATNITLVPGTLNAKASPLGSFWILGEVQNTGSSAGFYPTVTVNLYDAGDQLIETMSAFIMGGTVVKGEQFWDCGNVLLPGETGFFEVLPWANFSDVHHYTYTFDSSADSQTLAQATLSFTNPPTIKADPWGDAVITGKVTNNSNYYLVYDTRVQFALKNSAGKVIDVVSVLVDGPDSNGKYNTIQPGASESFSVSTWVDYSQYASYSYAFEFRELQLGSPPTYTLTVESNLDTGAPITVSPVDKNGNGNGTTNFTRSYEADTTVNLSAPAVWNDNAVLKWTIDGTDVSSTLANVTMTKNITAKVVYISTEASAIALNRTALYFTYVLGGAAPAPQTFIISNGYGGTLVWNINNNFSAVSCSPESGTGGTIITVTMDPSGYAVGSYTGALDITSPTAYNSPQQVQVNLKVINPGENQAPFGDFATPLDGSTVNSSIAVTGWVIDDSGVDSVKIYIENGGGLQYIGDAVFVEGARPDIEAAYPNYPGSYKAGWGYMLLTHFLPRGDDTYKLHAIAADCEGRTTTLGTSTITVNNADAVKPFGAIDTPAQGGTASGGSFANVGWVLTPMPNNVPTDGSTISVWVDGVELGHPAYNIYRSDIAGYFPGYANSDGAMARYDLDTTAYETGNHSIFWIATDSAGNSDGIGSRFFTIENSSPSTVESTGTPTAAAGNARTGTLTPTSGNSHNAKAVNAVQVENFFIHIPADTQSPVKVIRGFNLSEKLQTLFPDEDGVSRIVIKENERIEIDLSEMMGNGGVISGYMVSHPLVKSLPVGSTLDKKSGKFFWLPVAGFLGNYNLVFLVESQTGTLRKDVQVIIVPNFNN